MMECEVQFCELQKQHLVAEILRTSGKVKLAALGHSMLPTLWPGDLLTIQSISLEQVRPGDVVLYRRWERFFIHRVLSKRCATESDRPSLVTRGDSMTGTDAHVSPEELLGKIVSVESVSKNTVPVPSCSRLRRIIGLTLGYNNLLRSIALRWHAWRTRTDSGVAARRMPTGQTLG